MVKVDGALRHSQKVVSLVSIVSRNSERKVRPTQIQFEYSKGLTLQETNISPPW